MATILDQNILPINNKIKQYVPKMKSLSGKMLAELPSLLNSFLIINEFNLEFDTYGNPFIVTEKNERVSLAIAIVSGKEIYAYDRTNKELNLNDGIDIVGSIGYGVPSLFFKIPHKFWNIKIKTAKLAYNYAWEKTDKKGDKENIIMPIILIELDSNDINTVLINKLIKPTSKMKVVINELIE